MSLIIAADIGGTSIKTGIITSSGEKLYESSIPEVKAIETGEELLLRLEQNFREILQDCSLEPADTVAIGMGAPGIVNSGKGVFIYASNLPFDNLDVSSFMQERFKLPVFVTNDANCAALAEAKIGAAKDYQDSVTITLGTGLGCGFIKERKVISGFNGVACEFAHSVIVVGGEPCPCGRKGCFESYASATALIRDTKRAIEKNPDSILAETAQKQGEVSGKTVFDAEKRGDAIAHEVLENYIEMLSEGMANVVDILAPEIICISGGLSRQGDSFIKRIESATLPKCLAYGRSEMPVFVKASLQAAAGLYGAGLYACDSLLEKNAAARS